MNSIMRGVDGTGRTVPTGHRQIRIIAAAALGMALAVALTACGSSTESGGKDLPKGDQKLTVAIYTGSMASLQLTQAVANGDFKDNGLDVKLISIADGPGQAQALLAGSVDVMSNTPSNIMLANEKLVDSGAKFKIQGVINSSSSMIYSLMGRSGISWPASDASVKEKLQSLVGKKIGVTALGADTQNVMAGLLKENGIDPKKVTFIGIGANKTAVSAIEAARVDAAMVFEPSQSILTSNNSAEMLIDFRKGEGSSLFEQWSTNTWAARSDKLEENPEIFKRFQSGIAAANKYLHDPVNLANVVDLAAKDAPTLDKNIVKSMVEGSIPGLAVDFNCQILENMKKFYVPLGVLKTASIPPCDEFMWSGASKYVIK